VCSSDLSTTRLQAQPVVSPVLTRRVVLCASRHIPLSGAATAVAALTVQLAHTLCDQAQWLDATPVLPLKGPFAT